MPVGGDASGDDDGLGDDPPVDPGLAVGGVQEDVGKGLLGRGDCPGSTRPCAVPWAGKLTMSTHVTGSPDRWCRGSQPFARSAVLPCGTRLRPLPAHGEGGQGGQTARGGDDHGGAARLFSGARPVRRGRRLDPGSEVAAVMGDDHPLRAGCVVSSGSAAPLTARVEPAGVPAPGDQPSTGNASLHAPDHCQSSSLVAGCLEATDRTERHASTHRPGAVRPGGPRAPAR